MAKLALAFHAAEQPELDWKIEKFLHEARVCDDPEAQDMLRVLEGMVDRLFRRLAELPRRRSGGC